jgi:hypothetical protein
VTAKPEKALSGGETDVLKTVDVLDRATFFLDEPFIL